MKHVRTNPVGIDTEIERIARKLYDKLCWKNFDSYGRVDLHTKEAKVVPMYYIEEAQDYKEVLTDDKLSGHFFFVENENTTYGKQLLRTDVDIYFMLDLQKLKPEIPHRADEEVRMEILEVVKTNRFFIDNEFTVQKGINVLSNFEHDLVDLQPYHFLKVSGKISYKFKC